MFTSKYFVTNAEEISGCLKMKFCDQGFGSAGKCSTAVTKLFDVRRFHWPAGVSDTNKEEARFRMPRAMMEATDGKFDIMEMDSSESSSQDEASECYSKRRRVQFTSYGQRLNNCPMSRVGGDLLKVATYNVLSHKLLEMHRYFYIKCRENDLKWSTRSARLLDDFKFLNPDIFCLQEVQENQLEEFFKKELSGLGYYCVFKKRTHEKVDGCAIFFKTDKFDLIECREVELYRDQVTLLDRDNVGVIVKLALKSRPSQRVVIATTHLLFTPPRTDVRLAQTQLMLAEMERMAFKGGSDLWPIIFTGDMNYTPHSPEYNLVEQGLVQFDDQTSTDRTNILKSLGVTDSCQFEPVLHNRCDGLEEAPGWLTHGLSLGSAYSHGNDDVMEASTYQGMWQTVDYIFYSQKGRPGNREEGDLKLVSRLALPSAEEAATHVGHIPSSSCASDHLPLLATFHLPASNLASS